MEAVTVISAVNRIDCHSGNGFLPTLIFDARRRVPFDITGEKYINKENERVMCLGNKMTVVGVSLCVRKTRIKSMNLISLIDLPARVKATGQQKFPEKVGEIKQRKRKIA